MKNKICSICTGCGACFASCPKQCISMIENSIAEIEPYIDIKKCINCGLCKKICPQNQEVVSQYPQNCYVAWSKNVKDIVYSASGGVAATVARYQLDNNGIVYGCDYDEDLDLVHFKLTDYNDIIKMQSSKYSQSKAYHLFHQIKKELLHNESVVFIGTPCQIAGLNCFLNGSYENLITIDLVCHGTPPNKYLKDHIRALRTKLPISKIRFRGEFNQYLTMWNKNCIVYKKHYKEDSFFTSFYNNTISRNSCYSCKYAGSNRVSDITLADFWGLGKLESIPMISDRPSLVLINTPKGQKFFNHIRDMLFFEARSVDEAIKGNGRLINPPGKSLGAKLFQRFYSLTGFENAVKYSDLFIRAINRIKRIKDWL